MPFLGRGQDFCVVPSQTILGPIGSLAYPQPGQLTYICAVNAPLTSYARDTRHETTLGKFSDTLSLGGHHPGGACRLSESLRGADALSCSSQRPSRRAQIFDKGVDASLMQVDVILFCNDPVCSVSTGKHSHVFESARSQTSLLRQA